ncbi:hypothetical protein, partial [Neisseria meningitidis]|uniref:hypothetical protein n=1 Tax=Neisseria meningitidis TaxID=487 RepID=UPI001C850845
KLNGLDSRFCGNDGDRVAVIVDEQKPVQRWFALARRERFSKVLKHQVSRFRTIRTVCGSPPCPDFC